MANKPRRLTDAERAEVTATLRPLVERFAARFAVAPSTILSVVQAQALPRATRALLARHTPANPTVATVLARLCVEVELTPASVIEDGTETARLAREALIYTCRVRYELSFEIIGKSLAGASHGDVFDAYCRAVARVDNSERDFRHLLNIAVHGARTKVA